MSNAEILAIGSLVAERYHVDEALPSDGGLYRATDLRLDRDVTLRALPLPRSEADRARAAELAALAPSLAHPNLAPVLEVGVDAALEVQYAVTEALQGGTLAAL